MAKVKRTINSGFNAVLTPQRASRVSATEVQNFTLQDVKNRIPKDCQMHVMHTDGVGWTIIMVDRTLGHIRGLNEEAHHELKSAMMLALEDSIKRDAKA